MKRVLLLFALLLCGCADQIGTPLPMPAKVSSRIGTDLAVSVLKAWPCTHGGITVWLQVTNLGDWQPGPMYHVALKIDGPEVVEKWEVGPYPVPGPGGTRNYIYQIPFESHIPHHLKAVLDSRQVIDEPDEQNNLATCGIYIPEGR